MTNNRGTSNIDAHVGARLRVIRRLRDVTQTKLAEMAGISCQQIQKYETGQNRISVSRLWSFCEILKITPEFFFEGLNKPSPNECRDITPDFTYDQAYLPFKV